MLGHVRSFSIRLEMTAATTIESQGKESFDARLQHIKTVFLSKQTNRFLPMFPINYKIL